jgi:hypothetical protein
MFEAIMEIIGSVFEAFIYCHSTEDKNQSGCWKFAALLLIVLLVIGALVWYFFF